MKLDWDRCLKFLYLHFIFCTYNFTCQKVQKPPVKIVSGHTDEVYKTRTHHFWTLDWCSITRASPASKWLWATKHQSLHKCTKAFDLKSNCKASFKCLYLIFLSNITFTSKSVDTYVRVNKGKTKGQSNSSLEIVIILLLLLNLTCNGLVINPGTDHNPCCLTAIDEIMLWYLL